MSKPKLRAAVALSALALFAMGCWEQWSDTWFPQMKWQHTVQAFEAVNHNGQVEGFTPPEGAVPIDGGEAPVSTGMDAASVAAGDALVNPRDPTDYRSIQNGKAQYDTFCATCHGATGFGDGPVSAMGSQSGPFAGVLPLIGVVKARTDGHIYTTIRYGRRRMPAYGRIPAEDRWDIVNYVRFLDSKGGQL